MDNKQMCVQVVNLNTGKIFSLPTLYTDRTKACVCGQDYIRDRQAENISELLFFRVLDVRPDGTIAPPNELWNDDEEPEHGESVFGSTLAKLMIDRLKSKAPEAPEEPNYLFEHWND